MGQTTMPRQHLQWMTFILLAIFASRALLLNQLEMNHDEVWNAWQTSGTLAELHRWLPYDWPPLHFVGLWGWQNVVGPHPVALRLSSVLLMMLAAAITYRLTLRFTGSFSAALMVMVTYSALGFVIFLSTYVRAYMLMALLLPLTLWLALRYFDRPGFWRALWLALGMAALFYTSLTAVAVFALLGIITLVLYGGSTWRWWLPGLMAFVLAVPEILAKAELAGRRVAGEAELSPPPLEALLALYQGYTGHVWWLWFILIGMAVVALIIRRRLLSRRGLVVLLWAFVLPTTMYVLDGVLGFFSPQYAWWGTLGIALLVGWGLAWPKPWMRTGTLLMLVALMFVPAVTGYRPFDSLGYGIPETLPFEATFTEMVGSFQSGDVILIDPACTCGEAYEWDYYQRVYFDSQPLHITSPADHRRIWYVHRPRAADPVTRAAVENGRLAYAFHGPWELFFRLYIAPPDPTGQPFDNGMRFHGAEVITEAGKHEVMPLTRREGETIRLRLWWSTDVPIHVDYSLSVQIIGENGLLAQSDGPPMTIQLDPTVADAPPSATSQWQTGQFYVEERTLTLPYPMDRGRFNIMLAVVQWWDGERVPGSLTDSNDMLPLMELEVMAW